LFALQAFAALASAVILGLAAGLDFLAAAFGGWFAAAFAGSFLVVPRPSLGRALDGAFITTGGGRDAALILAAGAWGLASLTPFRASRGAKLTRIATFAARGALGARVALQGAIALAGRKAGIALGRGRTGWRQGGCEEEERDDRAFPERTTGRRAHVGEAGSIFLVHVP
jgi:hypothetical protein